MSTFDFFKAIKIWLISLFSFDVLLFLYLFILGRVSGELFLSNLVSPIAFLILISSSIVGFSSIIYSIVKKRYIFILHGLGILFASLLLLLALIIMALASIY